MFYLLVYDVVPDYLTRREAYRTAHIALANEAVSRGELLLGGALENNEDSALLLFSGDSPLHAENFAKNDPYVINGLVIHWQVKYWNIVVGAETLAKKLL